MGSKRLTNEMDHGRRLARNDPELTWGWGTPAGRLRAKRRARLVASAARLAPGIKALEIGCGTGLFTEMFAESGALLTAVEISRPLLEHARARNLPPDKVRFLEKPFEACGSDGPFQAVIGVCVLHHLDIRGSLQRIHELLEPGGFLSFTEPNMLNPQIMAQKNIPRLKELLGDSPDETAFFRGPLRKLLTRTGFGNIEITPFDWLHPHTPAPLMGKVERLGRLLERTPVLREFSGSLHIRARRPR